jgi:hypothetical protein
VFHSTLYDGALERACIEVNVPIFSVSVDVACQKLGTKMVANMLLDSWKRGQAKGPEFSTKFVPDPPSLPEITEVPEMSLCKIMDQNTVAIPSDIRQRFLRDPLRSKEWKAILAEFDKRFEAASQRPLGSDEGAPAAVANGAAESSEAGSANPWAGIFRDSPKSLEALESMTVSATFPLSSGALVCKITEGPQYYICATTAAGSFGVEEPVFSHGGGTWLLDSKAAKVLQASICQCFSMFVKLCMM